MKFSPWDLYVYSYDVVVINGILVLRKTITYKSGFFGAEYKQEVVCIYMFILNILVNILWIKWRSDIFIEVIIT